jgi:hypothetical protein
MVGTFTENFGFHATAFESPQRHKDWGALYPALQPGKNCLWGYVRDHRHTLGVTGADLFVHRAADGLAPARIELLLSVEDGQTYEILGTVKGLLPQPAWPNMFVHFGFTQWTCRGQNGYGDIQDVTQSGHMRRSRKSGLPA